MKERNKITSTVYILFAIVFLTLTSCQTKEELEYTQRSWEIKTKSLELEYLRALHNYRDDLRLEKMISDVDSIIESYDSTK